MEWNGMEWNGMKGRGDNKKKLDISPLYKDAES